MVVFCLIFFFFWNKGLIRDVLQNSAKHIIQKV